MTRVVFVFVDGLGLGSPDADHNPLRHPDLDLLANFAPSGWTPPPEGGRPDSLPPVERHKPLPFGGAVVATDASLGVTGLPQSATGQTAILTGENGAEALGGRHYAGFPTKTLKEILARASVFRRLREAGREVAFLNAFSPIFFELGEAVWRKPLGATTWAVRASGVPYRSFDDLAGGRAVFHDITHDSSHAVHYGLQPRTPEAAGRILAEVSAGVDFCLFEFFQTDKAGHAQDRAKAERELLKLERFLREALTRIDLTETVVILTSDHGNIENLGVKMHTHNPVPTFVFGPEAATLGERLHRLEYFTPEILGLLEAAPDLQGRPVA